MSNLTITTPGQTYIKTLASGASFSLEDIEGWNDLDPLQQSYINTYIDTMGQATLSRTLTGIPKRMFNEWADDENFQLVMEQVEEIFTEGLASVHFQDAVSNAKIRTGVLRARNAKGYEAKESKTEHQHLHLTALDPRGLLEALQGGTKRVGP